MNNIKWVLFKQVWALFYMTYNPRGYLQIR